jgi:predicted nucleic acid-binding protein
MIILESDVVSALMREPQDEAVHDWVNRQPSASIWTTSVTVFEVRFGIASLPTGRKRDALESAWITILSSVFRDQVLPFNASAATHTAQLAAVRKQVGLNIGLAETMKAGIALANDAFVATRNVNDFRDLGARVINLWQREGPD